MTRKLLENHLLVGVPIIASAVIGHHYASFTRQKSLQLLATSLRSVL